MERGLGWTGAALALAASFGLALGTDQEQRRPAVQSGAVGGVVLDARRAPVAEALVLICDAASGLPLGDETHTPFLGSGADGEPPRFEAWWSARTDADGRFRFEQVPAGRYRLIAQSWPDVARPEGVQEPNGLVVHLRGVAEGVVVGVPESEALELSPLGQGNFVYHRGASNDDWYLFLSTGATSADPVLGPLGWKGPFLQQAIGWMRMPGGHAIVRGLPERLVHFTLFANDSRPGFGAGSFRARSGEVVARDTNLVVGWSDGIHDPPERLEPLCAEVAALIEDGGQEALEELLVHGREEAWAEKGDADGFGRLFVVAEVLGPLEREIELPSGTRATLADLLAAAAYGRMRR